MKLPKKQKQKWRLVYTKGHHHNPEVLLFATSVLRFVIVRADIIFLKNNIVYPHPKSAWRNKLN